VLRSDPGASLGCVSGRGTDPGEAGWFDGGRVDVPVDDPPDEAPPDAPPEVAPVDAPPPAPPPPEEDEPPEEPPEDWANAAPASMMAAAATDMAR